MLGLRDNLILATTKLRVRRIRLIVTLIVAGILFTTLVFGSLIIRGTLQSLNSFATEGFLNRFMVNVFNQPDFELFQNPEFIKRVEALEKTRLAEQTKEAERLGIPFDAKTAPKAVSEYTGEGGKQKMADNNHPSTRQAVAEFVTENPRAKVEKLAKPYNPTAIYESFNFGVINYDGAFELMPIIKNEEIKPKQRQGFGPEDSFATFQSMLSAYDEDLLKPFLLEGASLKNSSDKAIPIFAPVDAVEKLLGLEPLSKKASDKDRLSRLKDIRTKAKDLPFEACYRNKTALNLRAEAAQQAADQAAHASEPGYQKPSLIYTNPTGPCQTTIIKTDTRTADEKNQATKQDQFNEKFGQPTAVTHRMKFRIVGVLPQIGALQAATGPETLISAFFTSTIGEGWFIPRADAIADPVLSTLVNDTYYRSQGARQLYIDFPDRTAHKRFIDERGCGFSENTINCAKEPDKVLAVSYGNPLATLYDLQKGFNKGLQIVLFVIAILAAIIMMGTIGKIIADSRKETSVFRALGAKRLEIAQIYLLYTGILATFSFFIALAVGLAAALYMESQYSPGLSVQAVLAFNAKNLDKTFHLIGFNILDFVKIYGFVLAISIISAVIPLLTNLSRNPVKDMREE